MGELRCCPFCGGKARIIYCGDEHIPQVRCDDCLAVMGWHCESWSAMRGELYFKTAAEAIKAWNRRAGDDGHKGTD
jgi:hypothetical protein